MELGMLPATWAHSTSLCGVGRLRGQESPDSRRTAGAPRSSNGSYESEA